MRTGTFPKFKTLEKFPFSFLIFIFSLNKKIVA